MQISFDEDDFKQVADNSTEWDAELAAQDRWGWIRDSSGVGEEKDFSNWRYGYWTENLVNMVLMRSWLDENSHPYAVVWDDSLRAYVVLTDYPSHWGEHPSSEAVTDVMALMKDKGFGTTVMMAAHMALGACTDRGTVSEWLQGLTNAEMYRVVATLRDMADARR
ncbi:hypothetical protein [Nocardia sp. NPDC057030]|uniref:hypothetical protein n=1 Tax=unclassified Nocardia TaxID=2637762 RepID=UPI00362C7C82